MPLFIFKRTQSLHLNSKDNKKWSFIHYIHIFYYLITYLDHLCIFSFLINKTWLNLTDGDYNKITQNDTYKLEIF